VFELTQALPDRWVTFDPAVRRQFLDLIMWSCKFDGVSLCPTYRRPFDLLAAGLVPKDGDPKG